MDNNETVPTTEDVLKEGTEGRRDLVWALVLCLVAVVVVRSFLFEPFKIPSSSMVPTLKIGDYIFVSKYSYGLVIPFTKIEFLPLSSPKRGDVMVFLFPRKEELHYIKRVIGLPGDRLEFKGRDVFINGELVKKELATLPQELEDTDLGRVGGQIYKETIDGTTHYVRYSNRADFDHDHVVDKVPENTYFMVGDNRDESYDSRAWGSVPRGNVRGRARMIWMSLDHDVRWGALDKIRWDRCGIAIH